MGTDKWQSLIGQNVVIDTNSPYIYLGKLAAADDWVVVLADVDVHDHQDGRTTKEQYINEAVKSGIKINRRQVIIHKEQIISFSRLADVITY